jgi:hypothetical protein
MNGVAVLAGSISTALFVVSALPMLYKAACTRDLGSYSLGNLLLANVGNGFYAIYVFSMPVGPIWALHSFYMLSSALMLVWYLRYEVSKRRRGSAGVDRATAALPPPETASNIIAVNSPAGVRNGARTAPSNYSLAHRTPQVSCQRLGPNARGGAERGTGGWWLPDGSRKMASDQG